MIVSRIKRILLGQPLSNEKAAQELIPKWKALAVLSSDALSSVAYATEEILIPLAAVSAAAMAWAMPIAVAIAALLLIVTASYRQTIHAYPNGGGAYSVVRENLGAKAGLIAGGALLIDYVLTVAVSVAAGVENLVSAFPALLEHKTFIGTLIVFLLALVNLRGVRQTSTLFALPTYLFIFSIFAMIGVGLWKVATGQAIQAYPIVHEVYPGIPLFLILRAFASGCAALTGVEAISNGVPLFRPSARKNAKATLVWMAVILGSLFLGISVLVHTYGVTPHEGETAISSVARLVFNGDGFYYWVQGSTALILFLAANASYADFPRLSSFLARDRFLPRQMASVGDRLVFSNGILGLSLSAALLLVVFEGRTHHLIPLYAIGVFLSFTLSQFGMVRHHWKKREKGWVHSLFFNALGAIVTFVVLLVIGTTKFLAGAWMVLLLIPVFVFVFIRINEHYRVVSQELSLERINVREALEPVRHTVIVPISAIHRGVIDALRYALSISSDVRACFVEINPEETQQIKEQWKKCVPHIPFVVLKSPYRSVIRPLLEYIDDVEQTNGDDLITIVIPEFVTARWWHQVLHNQTAFLIRTALMFRRRKIVISVRYHLKET